MVTQKIRSDIRLIEENSALYQEPNFTSRAEAIDYLEFNVMDRIEGLLQTSDQAETLISLSQSAERVKHRLEETDVRLFRRVRGDIRAGKCLGAALKTLIETYVPHDPTEEAQQDEIGYDHLDALINGVVLTQPVPMETIDIEPEMVPYQQTPARIILELVEKTQFTDKDVFYDLGSGLGQVPILVNLLSGVAVKGIEIEPAYCDYASACAADLNLTGVEFVNSDARNVDYSDGTTFFMYTPFGGKLLQEVLGKLKREAHRREIRLFTYGPCTPFVSRQSWLACVQNGTHLYQLGVFRSLPLP